MQVFTVKTVAQHLGFDVEIGTVIAQKRGGPAGEIRVEIIEKGDVIGAHLSVAAAGVEIGKLHGRIARALEIDAKIAPRGGQIARIGLDLTEKAAHGFGKSRDAVLKLVVARAANGIAHLRKQLFGLVDLARDPVALHAVDTLHPFFAEGIKPKDLLGIPWRLAFALQDDGWWLRSDVIWAKPNPMPESVTDRPTKAHEYLFLLTKSPRYYWDAEAVRELKNKFTQDRPDYLVQKMEQLEHLVQTAIDAGQLSAAAGAMGLLLRAAGCADPFQLTKQR